MNLQASPPETTTPTAAAEAMQHPVSAENKCCIFYKLIVKSIIQQKELAIPNKFSRKFGDKLSDVVTLTDSNLTKWKIGLKRLNHRLWFHHGWPKFVEDHSIHAGSFLIFKYEENSNFAVNIYELVASDMKSSSDNAGPSSEPAQPEQIEVARVDTDDLIETHPNSKRKISIISELDGLANKTKPEMDVHDKNASFLKWKRRPRAVTDEERRCAVLAAENFKSDLPFCRITMRVSYVYYSFDLKLPSEFSKKYLKDIQGVIQLQDPNGKKWPVRCFNNKGKARLNTGWHGFVVENNLDDGDVCIFELVQRDDIVLKVYIFRAANPEVVQASSESMPEKKINNVYSANQQKLSSSIWKRRLISELGNKRKVKMEAHNKASSLKWKRIPKTVTDEEKRQAIHAAANFTSQFPFCQMVMYPSYVYSNFNLFLPAGFSNKYLLDKRGPITLQDSNGRKWPARCWYRKNSAIITTGWREFVVDNDLHGGDVCIFELVQMEDDIVVLKVSIFRAAAIPEEEIVQVSSDSLPQQTDEDEQDVNLGQSIDFEDSANDLMEKLNNDVYAETGIRVDAQQEANNFNTGPSSEPARAKHKDIYQTVMFQSPSKTPTGKPFAEFSAEKTSSVTADSIMRPVLEMRDEHAPKIGTKFDTDELIQTQPNSKWKRRLISELDGRLNKTKPRMDVHDKKAPFLKWKRRTREVTDEERRCAVLAAENFKSDLPFCRVMMRVSYVYYKFELIIPSKFSNKYLKDIQGVIQLQDPNGRKWPVRCSNNKGNARLNTGWRGFVVENNLDDGDVCIFELVQRDDIVLKVSIFRAANSELVQASSESMPKSTPSMFVDNIPSERREHPARHSGIGTEDYANDFMDILNEDIDIIAPQYSAPGCSKDNNRFAECMAEKTSSNIDETRHNPVQETGIKVMETRKEINNLYPKLPNSIWKRRLISELGDFRNKKKAKMEARNKASSLKWKRRARTVTDEEKRQAVHAAANFTSKFPFCRMVMQPSYVYSHFKLFLPAGFSKKYLLGIRGPITLQNSNGRKWSAWCRFKKSTAIIATGWHDFVVDNNLNGGDVCIFELVQVEEDTVVLKVSIFRAAAVPQDEIRQLYGKSVPQKIEGSKQEVNPAQRIDIKDYANDFTEKSDDIVSAKTGVRVDAQHVANNFSIGPRSEPARTEQIKVTSIRSPQSKDIFQTVILPSPSKTPKGKPFAEFNAEKTFSVTADSIVKPVLEMHPKIGIAVDADELMETQPNSKCKRKLISELDGCHDKKKPRVEVHDKKTSFLKWERTPREVTDVERKWALLAAKNFKSNLPFCRIMMRVSHVYYRFELNFPSEFSKKHLKDTQGLIELQDPSGRKWLVRCSYKDNRGRATVTTGWRGFVVDNNLDDGDVCIFELVQRDDIVLKVSIFRAANPDVVQASSESMPKGTPSMVVDNISSEDYANDFMEILNEDIDNNMPQYSAPPPGFSKDNSRFAECMTSSNIADSVGWFPFEIRDKTVQETRIEVMETRKEINNLHPKLPNNIWKRRLISEMGDCCNKKKAQMEARNKASSLKWNGRTRTVTDEEKRQAVDAAANFTSKFPFCRMVMHPSYVSFKFHLCLPAGFSKKYLLGIQKPITLQDLNGRKWPTRCWYRNSRAVITKGWREFAVDNNLDDGDVCIFELIQREEDVVVLKVSIFGAAAIPEEVVRVSGESVPQKTVEGEREVSLAQRIDIEDNAMEKLNKDVYEPARAEQIEVTSIRSPQSKDIYQTVMLQSPSKTPKDKPFAEFSAEKTSSVTADSIVKPVLEMRGEPAPKIGISELDDCRDKKNPKMDVHDKKASFLKWNRRPRALTYEETRQAVLAAENFKSDFPFCRIMMHISDIYELYLPAEFSNKHLKDIEGVIKLQDPNGRKWPVWCSYKNNRAKVTAGWHAFMSASKLDNGDVCIFELVQTDGIVLKVSIFQAANPEELVQVSSESMPENVPAMVDDDIALDGREGEVNFAQNLGTEDYANDFVKNLNNDIDIVVPQTPGCSKDNNGFAESMAEKTSSNIDDSVGWLPFEIRDEPKRGIKVNADHLLETRKEINNLYPKLPNSIWKRRLISELGDCCNKKKAEMDARNKASSLNWKGRAQTVTDEEKRQAVDAAANFTSEFPYCRMVMQPSYVSSKFRLFLPSDFSKKYLLGIQKPITLQDSNGRKWPAQCQYMKYRAVISTGWREFAVDNNLDDGDVCIFELVQVENDIVVMKVSIFRAASIPEEEIVRISSESVPKKTVEGEREVNLAQRIDIEDNANGFIEQLNKDVYAQTDIRVDAHQEANSFSTGPSSEIALSEQIEVTSIRSPVYQTVLLPPPSKTPTGKTFAELNVQKTSSVTADSIVKPVLEMRPKIGIAVDADELMETRKEINNLYLLNQPKLTSELGDSCDKKKANMEVRNKASSLKWRRIPRTTVTDEEKRRAVHAAANFTSKFPFCRMVMKPSYVYSHFSLFLPAGFSKKYMLDIRGPITLQDSNGRKWPAQCRCRGSTAIINAGWREFVVDNNLDDGDVCIFELVQVENDIVVMKVSFFRASAIPEEEIVRVYGESVLQKIEGSEQEVNLDQCIDIEDNAEMGTRVDAQQEANNFDLTNQLDTERKRRLSSELDEFCNKKKAKMEEPNKASALKWKRKSRAVTDEERRLAVHAAANFTSKFPFFQMVMSPSYVYYNFTLYIPAYFSKKHLKDTRVIKLRDPNDREWLAPCNYTDYTAKLCKGWGKFVVHNNLHDGDVCIFELVQKEEDTIVLKVSIFRAAKLE